MMKEEETNKSGTSSGFVHDITDDVAATVSMKVDTRFENITKLYTSNGGHTRLFTATRYGKRYVLKCLKPEFLLTPFYQQALQKEFEIGLQLDHPNICKTIGMEEVETLGVCIIMEYVDGITLKEIMQSGSISNNRAWTIAEQLADAMDYMHNKQIIHRDLKPENIMITHNASNVKVIDFSLSDSDVYNILKMPAGTKGYIAPEQLDNNVQAEVKADIYSYGVVVGELATHCNDKHLRHIQAVCIHRDPQFRPTNRQQIWAAVNQQRKHRKNILALTVLTIFTLAMMCISMYHYFSTSDKSDIETADTLKQQRENIILDVQKW